MPSAEFQNSLVALEYVWGGAAGELQERLMEADEPTERFDSLEKILTERLLRSRAGHPAVDYALGHFHRIPHSQTISAVTDAIGLSSRRFIEVFKDQVGLTPKLFCRVRRFQEDLIMTVKPIPDGFYSITPYLIVGDGAGAIEFYERAFGAEESFRMADPSGKIGHAEMKIGNSIIMLADEFPEMGYVGPKSLGGSPVGILLYVEDVDESFARAVAEGAQIKKPVQDQFYGDRSGTIEDPFGHLWTIATHMEDVAMDELQSRFEKMMQGGA